jgi:hypothetical protein
MMVLLQGRAEGIVLRRGRFREIDRREGNPSDRRRKRIPALAHPFPLDEQSVMAVIPVAIAYSRLEIRAIRNLQRTLFFSCRPEISLRHGLAATI